ncbi:MAG TPA: hypothetical protein VG406_23505 [Isosphaeraceae bacterium]|jgi:hypothetical protein|nr:hypothetical protein [Isosphaeraceae bacterium]
MRANPYLALIVLLAPPAVRAQDAYKVEPLKEAAPSSLAAPLRGLFEASGYRVLSPEGKPFVDLWLRKGVPASARPTGPKGTILFPVLSEGELLGAFRFHAEGRDYRDQTIAPGVYTLRYGLQPENGDHLGTSPYRDFALLIAAAKDKMPASIPKKALEERSAEAAGTSHPAVFMLRQGPDKPPAAPEMVHDDTLDTWGAVVPLPLQVKGTAGAISLPIQVVVVGSKTA